MLGAFVHMQMTCISLVCAPTNTTELFYKPAERTEINESKKKTKENMRVTYGWINVTLKNNVFELCSLHLLLQQLGQL